MKHRDRLLQHHELNPSRPESHYVLAFFANSIQDSELEIEETRGIALHLPHAPQARLDDALATSGGGAHRFIRQVRTCGANDRPAAQALLERQRDEVERAGRARLIVGFEYVVGPVMDWVEIWRVPGAGEGGAGGAVGEGFATDAVDAGLRAQLAALAPERERRWIAPTSFSRLR